MSSGNGQVLLASVCVAFLGAAAAPTASAQTVKQVFDKLDLIGRYAQNCKLPASEQNLHIIHQAVEGDRVRRTQFNAPATRQFSLLIDRAAQPKPNEVSYGGQREDGRYNSVLRVDGKRIRVMESAKEGGEPVITGGRFANGKDTPWFDKCLGPENTVTSGVYTPDRVNGEIEEAARKREQAKSNPVLRTSFWHLAYPRNQNEMNALARYSVLLLTVISQKPEELPLKRVFHRAGGQDRPVAKISSVRSELPAGSVLGRKYYGPYRETGFYLVPTMIVLKEGQILIDFAANSSGYSIWKLPAVGSTEQLQKYSNLDPGDAKPSLAALQTLFQQKFTGFPVPSSLP